MAFRIFPDTYLHIETSKAKIRTLSTSEYFLPRQNLVVADGRQSFSNFSKVTSILFFFFATHTTNVLLLLLLILFQYV